MGFIDEDDLRRAKAEVVDLKRRLGESEHAKEVWRRECMHWKCNHDNQVRNARVLKERLDMPVERVKAYNEIVNLREQVEWVQSVLAAHGYGGPLWPASCPLELWLDDLCDLRGEAERAELAFKAIESGLKAAIAAAPDVTARPTIEDAVTAGLIVALHLVVDEKGKVYVETRDVESASEPVRTAGGEGT